MSARLRTPVGARPEQARISLRTSSGSSSPFSGDPETYVVERYTRDGDELRFTGEVHDPRFYDEPYVVNGHWIFAPDGEIWEYECIPEFGGIE